jgi:hypothetical protein
MNLNKCIAEAQAWLDGKDLADDLSPREEAAVLRAVGYGSGPIHPSERQFITAICDAIGTSL